MNRVVVLITFLTFTVACGPRDRAYRLQGQVLSVTPDHTEATIKHEEIQGLMPAMTMPYKVRDARLFAGIVPGDLVNATLVVASNDAYLSTVQKVGTAPLPAAAPPASSGFEILRAGEPVPDVQFVNQDGRRQPFSAFAGSPVVVTFMYTRCPLPNFCPLMDRNFARIQQAIAGRSELARVHLVSVSFDPITDTPAVLKKHAQELGADPARWTFFTGDRDDIDRFAARFGVSVTREPNDPLNITHNLRTAIVGADGKLVKTYTGNEWTPDEVVKDLERIVS
jgi:protein SCO1/2